MIVERIPLFVRWVDPWRLRYFPRSVWSDECHRFARYYESKDGQYRLHLGPRVLPKPGGRLR